jgi:hypothetical protein
LLAVNAKARYRIISSAKRNRKKFRHFLFSFQENYQRSALKKHKAGLPVHIIVFLSRVLKTVLQYFEVSVAAIAMCREISVTFPFTPFRLAPLTQ